MGNVDRPAPAPYGFVNVDGTPLPFLPEQRVLADARAMLDDGVFLRGVVRAFRCFGYTRRDGRPFTKASLRRVLRRGCR